MGVKGERSARHQLVASERATRHCWACLRRRLVCDFTRPSCNRCYKDGMDCPGYGTQKPLRWKGNEVVARPGSRWAMRVAPISSDREKDKQVSWIQGEPEAETASNTAISRFQVTTDVCDVFQAVEYYNTCIYQDLMPLHELGPNPSIYPITSSLLRHATKCPPHLAYSFVCVNVGHRANRSRGQPLYRDLVETFYRYRGMAIRALSEEIESTQGRTSDVFIAGALTLLLADVQQGASGSWRCHIQAIHNLTTMHGGISSLAGHTGLDPLLLAFMFLAVMGNSTSPAQDLVGAESHFDEISSLVQHYSSRMFGFYMCPPLLFVEIIKINHLRMRAIASAPTAMEDLSQDAHDILARISEFSPERWAEVKPGSNGDWQLLGRVYQVAVSLYCLSSLQTLHGLPSTASARATRAGKSQLLQLLLKIGLASPKVERFMLWPLVVLGVEAVNISAAMRAFVARKLPEMSHRLGTYIPLTAREVLEKFWASGETDWDYCFDGPHLFATQLAVDLRPMMLPKSDVGVSRESDLDV